MFEKCTHRAGRLTKWTRKSMENHLFEMENHLNRTSIFGGCMLIFQGVYHLESIWLATPISLDLSWPLTKNATFWKWLAIDPFTTVYSVWGDSFDFWDKIYYISKRFLVVYLNLSHDCWCGYIHLDVVHQLWQLDILPTSNGWFHTILHHEKIRGTSVFLVQENSGNFGIDNIQSHHLQQICCSDTGHTVDGWNPANQLRLVVYPIIYKVLAPSKRWLFGISAINSSDAFS